MEEAEFDCSLLLQTKELISEIELLEEEVANREQHVLSLYRNIFEQCVSQSSSQQSSTKASPAHSKNLPRKHPSIISSAFCSSKKFPLRPFKALIGSGESGKRTSKKEHALPFAGKTEVHFEKPYPNSTKVSSHFLCSIFKKCIQNHDFCLRKRYIIPLALIINVYKIKPLIASKFFSKLFFFHGIRAYTIVTSYKSHVHKFIQHML